MPLLRKPTIGLVLLSVFLLGCDLGTYSERMKTRPADKAQPAQSESDTVDANVSEDGSQ